MIASMRKAAMGLLIFGITYASITILRPIVVSNRPLPSSDEFSGACSIWFIGSSTISRWSTLPHDLAPWKVNNRGVFGALAGEIATRFQADDSQQSPEIIVLYVGDNDLANGARPISIKTDIVRFLTYTRRKMPSTRVVVLGVKPSPGRWPLRAEQLRLDELVRQEVSARSRTSFADVASSLLIAGKPGPYYVGDGIHLNPRGYRLLSEAVRRAIEMSAPPGATARCSTMSRVAS